jgi:hypothetical protein
MVAYMERKISDALPSIGVNLSAKAAVEAKVSTEIPAASSGRLVDAITDIFRPFSERRGLKADQIRLQREDILIQIAEKVRKRLEIEGIQPAPVPNKFLVPFLEKASLEEQTDLVDRWADLLANSVINPDAARPRYIQILSEMAPSDARTLQEMLCGFYSYDPHSDELTWAIAHSEQNRGLPLDVHNWSVTESDEGAKWDASEITFQFSEAFRQTALVRLIYIRALQIDDENFDNDNLGLEFRKAWDNAMKVTPSIDVLVSLGLLEFIDHSFNFPCVGIPRYRVSLRYASMTSLGGHFISACSRSIPVAKSIEDGKSASHKS